MTQYKQHMRTLTAILLLMVFAATARSAQYDLIYLMQSGTGSSQTIQKRVPLTVGMFLRASGTGLISEDADSFKQALNFAIDDISGLQEELDAKVSTLTFSSGSAALQSSINSKLPTTTFVTGSASLQAGIDAKVSTATFSSGSAALQSAIDSKVSTTTFQSGSAALQNQINYRVVKASATLTSDADLSLGSVSFGTDQTAAAQVLLDQAATAPTLIVWDVKISCTGLKVRGNTKIWALPGCGAILRNAANKPLLSNYNPTASTIQDENIDLDNGIWNANGDNQSHDTPEEGWIVGVRMMGVRNLNLRNVTLYNPRTFMFHGANLDTPTIENVKIDVGVSGSFNKDGIHITGPARGITIRRLDAKCKDDAIAINANEITGDLVGQPSDYGPYSGPGDIYDVTIDDVTFRDSTYGIRFLSTVNAMDRVSVSNLKGTTTLYAVLIDNMSESAWFGGPPGDGNFGSFTFDGVDVELGSSATNYKNAYIYVSANARSLRFRNVNRGNFTLNFPTIFTSTSSVISQLVLDGWTAMPATGTQTVFSGSFNGFIGTLSINDGNFANGTGTSAFVNAGRIQQLGGAGNVLNGYTAGLITNVGSGTVVNNTVSSTNVTIDSLWTLQSGTFTQNPLDPGYLTIATAGSTTRVGHLTDSDGFSGNVQVSSRLNFSGGSGSVRGGFLIARGTAPIPNSTSTGYEAAIDMGDGQPTKGLQLYKIVSGSLGALGSRVSFTPAAATEYRTFLITKNSGTNVVVTGKVQRVTDGKWLTPSGTFATVNVSGGTSAVVVTDTTSPIQGAGKAGVGLYSDSNTSPLIINNFRVEAAP